MNTGCDAEPRLEGGAVELFRILESLPDRPTAFVKYRDLYGSEVDVPAAPPKPFDGRDFVRWPAGSRMFFEGVNQFRTTFTDFAAAQWGLTETDLAAWGCRWAISGPAAWRIVIPVTMGGRPVGWQARSVMNAVPKYLTSRYGKESDPEAQCGRPASAMLFNADALPEGGEALVLEGAANAMAWHRRDRARTPVAVALLGVALTQEKAALLGARRLERIVVALDDEPAARRRGRRHAEGLRAWVSAEVVAGRWVGGKDLGSGARLEIEESEPDILDRVRSRLGKDN